MSILGQESLTFKRFAAGSRGTDGRWTDGAATSTTLLGSVQPMNGNDLSTLPEGERSRRGRKVYTTTELRTVDQAAGTAADQLQIDGEWWEVRSVANERSVIAHYKVLVLALQEAPS